MLKKYLITYSLIAISVVALAQNKYQYNFKKGDTFSISQESTQNIEQEIMGMNQNIKNELGGIMKFTVTDVNADNYTLTMSYTKFVMNMSSPIAGILMDIDTSNEPNENDMQALMFHGLLNQDLTFKMRKDGDIISLDGSEELLDAMLEKANLGSSVMADEIKASLSNQWGDKTLINSIEQMLFVYSDSSNDTTWQNEYSGNVTTKNTWIVDSENSQTTNLSAVSDVSMNITNAQVSMSLTGKQNSVATVNSKNGLFTILETSGTTTGIAKSAQLPDEDIPVTINFKNIYKTIN